jgi:hypothetical protein
VATAVTEPGADELDGSVRWRRTAVATRRTPEAVLVLPIHADGSDPIVLTDSAIAIWDEIAVSSTLDEVVERLAVRYDATAETIRAAVTPVLAELVRQGALEECG